MRYSQLLCPTLREDPSEAETISHKLMLRAGMIRQLAAGIYSLLPVGLRVIRNVEKIVREEMNRAGAQEVSLPAIHPAELWKESGRWELIGKELLRMKDRNQRDFCFGPTHEEVITDLVRREIRSYKDLPRNFYQIQVKFRDEVRPRFGLMRCREFTMKDAYSFDVDDAASEKSYLAMREAYNQIFRRCGLEFRAVDADSGNIGGSMSQEFMVLAASGEDEIFSCVKCDYAANAEKAAGKPAKGSSAAISSGKEKKRIPNKHTVKEQAEFLGYAQERIIKTLIYKTEQAFVAVQVPGDREINETKLKGFLGGGNIWMASEPEMRKLTGTSPGSVGPIELKIEKGGIERLISDELIRSGEKYVVGANEAETHWLGVTAGSEFPLGERGDIHRVIPGDRCTKCGGELRSDRGIEVGHIFKLGTKYSDSMKAQFTDREGKLRPAVMGCYGIGIGRTAAAAIEQNHDEDGIVFPPPLAPFDIEIVAVDPQKEAIRKESEKLYSKLTESGHSPLLDDRDEGAGRKFKDADLLGIPIRITVGEKGLAQSKVEVKSRQEKKGEFLSPESVPGWIEKTLANWKRRTS